MGMGSIYGGAGYNTFNSLVPVGLQMVNQAGMNLSNQANTAAENAKQRKFQHRENNAARKDAWKRFWTGEAVGVGMTAATAGGAAALTPALSGAEGAAQAGKVAATTPADVATAQTADSVAKSAANDAGFVPGSGAVGGPTATSVWNENWDNNRPSGAVQWDSSLMSSPDGGAIPTGKSYVPSSSAAMAQDHVDQAPPHIGGPTTNYGPLQPGADILNDRSFSGGTRRFAMGALGGLANRYAPGSGNAILGSLNPAEYAQYGINAANTGLKTAEFIDLHNDRNARRNIDQQKNDSYDARTKAQYGAPASPIGKLIHDRDALSPNDPNRGSYDAMIGKETTAGGGNNRTEYNDVNLFTSKLGEEMKAGKSADQVLATGLTIARGSGSHEGRSPVLQTELMNTYDRFKQKGYDVLPPYIYTDKKRSTGPLIENPEFLERIQSLQAGTPLAPTYAPGTGNGFYNFGK